MRFPSAGMCLLFAALLATTTMPVHRTAAAGAYCPNPAHANPGKVPAELRAAVAKAFQTDKVAIRYAAYVRCVGTKLQGCYVGANLDCFKADTRRALPGATSWCRQNPGSNNVPMAATGHDTIYEWSCKGSLAVAGKAMVTVDPQGFIAENWKEIP
jgi:hypothetical protein